MVPWNGNPCASVFGLWFSAASLRTTGALAKTARAINAICIFRFILFLDDRTFCSGLLCSSLLSFISCRSMSRHKLKDPFLPKADGKFETVLRGRNSDQFESNSAVYLGTDRGLTNACSASCHFATCCA